MSSEAFKYLFKKIENEMQIITEIESSANKSVHRSNWLRYFECEIKGRRIVRILSKFIDSVELIFCLEELIKWNQKNPEVLMTIIQYKCGQLASVDWSEIVYCLTNSHLYNDVPKYTKTLTNPRRNVLKSLNELKRVLVYKLKMIAPKDLIKEKIFHQMFRNNEKNKDRIVRLVETIKNEELKLKKNLEEKNVKIAKCQKDIDMLKKISEIEINDQVRKSEEAMIAIYTVSENSKAHLTESVRSRILKYETILNSNLLHQKEIRNKKAQVQNILKTCINKYDKDIGDRTNELNSLQHHLAEQTREFNAWYVEYLRQQQQYFDLMREKEAEEKRKQEEKLLMFMMNRSAITIQRAWRRVLAKKKKSKKKGKKGKK